MARLGRWVADPHAIEVASHGGRVLLSGPILAHERDALLERVSSVPGVRAVQSRLELHDGGAHVPALQGGSVRVGERSAFMQANWAPGPRLLALAAGTALAAFGLGRRSAPGALLGLAGATLAVRAAANRPLGRMLAGGAHASAQAQEADAADSRSAAQTSQAPFWPFASGSEARPGVDPAQRAH